MSLPLNQLSQFVDAFVELSQTVSTPALLKARDEARTATTAAAAERQKLSDERREFTREQLALAQAQEAHAKDRAKYEQDLAELERRHQRVLDGAGQMDQLRKELTEEISKYRRGNDRLTAMGA
jgi:hypothetical protein